MTHLNNWLPRFFSRKHFPVQRFSIISTHEFLYLPLTLVIKTLFQWFFPFILFIFSLAIKFSINKRKQLKKENSINHWSKIIKCNKIINDFLFFLQRIIHSEYHHQDDYEVVTLIKMLKKNYLVVEYHKFQYQIILKLVF